jgi:CBS domain-containing protein
MKQWCVSDVMTEKVVAVSADAAFKDVVETLALHGISAMPVVDAGGGVIGVVSEADLLHRVEAAAGEPHHGLLARKRRRAGRATASADAAGDLMSTPAVVVAPSVPVAAAARLMEREGVKRLPVVAEGRLVGIVSRGDLLRIYRRDDQALREEIVDQVLGRTLWIEPRTVSVSVEKGIVTLRGPADRRSTRDLIVRLVSMVVGVVDVVDELTCTYDDTGDIRRGGYLMRPSRHDLAPGAGDPE